MKDYLFHYSLVSSNGIKSFEKRLKLFQYLKNSIDNNGFIFLQEMSMKDEQKWKDDFKCPLLFSRGKIDSCGVAIDYFRTKDFKVV